MSTTEAVTARAGAFHGRSAIVGDAEKALVLETTKELAGVAVSEPVMGMASELDNTEEGERTMNPIHLDMVCRRAILHYGEQKQKIKAIEELGELSIALARDLNQVSRNPSEVIEEIADVKIMIEQLLRIPSIDHEAVLSCMESKITRLERRMDLERYE